MPTDPAPQTIVQTPLEIRHMRWFIIGASAIFTALVVWALFRPSPPDPVRDKCLSEPGRVYYRTLRGDALCLRGERME
jgi:hypothetical protein